MKRILTWFGAIFTMMMPIGLSSCNDKDDLEELIEVVSPAEDKDDLSLAYDDLKIKIGAENRLTIPVVGAKGNIHAVSHNEGVAKIIENSDGTCMIEGLANGQAEILLSDAANRFLRFNVGVYTTDKVELNTVLKNVKVPFGKKETIKDIEVVSGNGQYLIESDNTSVICSIDSETGSIELEVYGRMDPYEAHVKVTDAAGFTAECAINVTTEFIPFSEEELDAINKFEESTVWADCEVSRYHTPADWDYREWGMGAFIYDETETSTTIGWWSNDWGMDNGGMKIEFPAGAEINKSLNGKLYFQYSNPSDSKCGVYDSEVKILENNDTRIIAIAYQLDIENERYNRGYIVLYKADIKTPGGGDDWGDDW